MKAIHNPHSYRAHSRWLFSVCQIYKVWKQFTTIKSFKFFHLCCFQYVKFIKFESNSQHIPLIYHEKNSCFQYVKFIKFESNSQPGIHESYPDMGCFQYVKFIKFESNSQQNFFTHPKTWCCFQYVKFIKFESNSQLCLYLFDIQ